MADDLKILDGGCGEAIIGQAAFSIFSTSLTRSRK